MCFREHMNEKIPVKRILALPLEYFVRSMMYKFTNSPFMPG